MQARPLDVVDGDLVQAADLLARPVVARHATSACPSPDVAVGDRGPHIDVDARGSGIGNGVDVVLDILNLVAVEDTHLEGGALGEGHRGRGCDHRAGGSGLAAVGGIDELGTVLAGSHGERYVAHIVASSLAHNRIAQDAAILSHMLPVNAVADEQVVTVTALHEGVAARRTVVDGTAQLQVQVATGTLGLPDVATIALLLG